MIAGGFSWLWVPAASIRRGLLNHTIIQSHRKTRQSPYSDLMKAENVLFRSPAHFALKEGRPDQG
jgi:hypothetical protein